MTGFLDSLPPAMRHALLVASGLLSLCVLNYVEANYTTWNLSVAFTGLIAFALPLVIGYVTPITTQYGAGSGSV